MTFCPVESIRSGRPVEAEDPAGATATTATLPTQCGRLQPGHRRAPRNRPQGGADPLEEVGTDRWMDG